MKSIILIRTSTKEQNPQLQLKECQEFNDKNNWECIKVFEKQESAYKNEEGVWKDEIEFAKNNDVKNIIVWNMDRYSRLPPEKVLDEIKMLSLMHNIKIHAVKGDAWSEVAQLVGKLNDMGYLGQAMSEFLEKVIRGIEHNRAYQESKVKSERVKLAVRKKENQITQSYKGNKWGRKQLSTQKKNQIKQLHESGLSMKKIAKQLDISIGVVHKYLTLSTQEKQLNRGISSID